MAGLTSLTNLKNKYGITKTKNADGSESVTPVGISSIVRLKNDYAKKAEEERLLSSKAGRTELTEREFEKVSAARDELNAIHSEQSKRATKNVGVKYTGRQRLSKTEQESQNQRIKDLRQQIKDAGTRIDIIDQADKQYNLYLKQTEQAAQIKQHGNYNATIDESENDAYYRAVNGLVAAGTKLDMAQNRAQRNSVSSNSKLIYNQMTDEERNTYNYIFDTEGSEAAKKYLEILEYDLAADYKQQRTKDAQDWVNSGHAVSGTAMSIAEGAVSDTGGALSFYGEKALRDIGIIDSDLPINYQKTFASSTWSNAAQEQVLENIDSPVGQFLYSTGVSIADNAVRNIIFAPLGTPGVLGAMALRVAGQSVNEGLERGMTEDQAAVYGGLAAAGEVVGEVVPVDRLLKIKSPKTLKELLLTLGGQAVVEGFGEGITTLWNAAVTAGVAGELSDYNIAKANYINAGYSEEEAEKQATRDFYKQLALDVAGGFVSGIAMGGGAMALDAVANRAAGSKAESTAASSLTSDIDSTEADKAANKYQRQGMDAAEAVQKAQQDIQNKKAKSYTDSGMTAEEATAAVQADDIATAERNKKARGEILSRGLNAAEGSAANKAAKEIKAKLNTGETVTAKEWQSLIKEIAKSISLEETKSAIKKAAQKSGETVSETDIDVMAAAMEKNFRGKTISESENKLIKGSEAAKTAYSELTGLDYSTGEKVESVVSKKEEAYYQSTKAKLDNVKSKLVTVYAGEGKSNEYKNTLSNTYKAYLSITEHASETDKTLVYSKISAEDFADTFDMFYSAGKSGEDSLAALKNELKSKNAGDAAIDAFTTAYKLGQSEKKQSGIKNAKAKQAELNARLKSGSEGKARAPKGVARSITTAELNTDAAKEAGAKAVDMKRHFSQKQRAAIAFARELANATDINIVFYQTEDGKGANGWYDAETDTIYIDLFSGFNNEQAMLRTLSHELTHFIEKYSPEHYEGFKSFLLDYYYGKDEGATLERLIENEKRLAPNQTREYWENEVVANASEMFVKDEGAMRALIGEHADIAKSVDQWFSKMNYALRRAYKGVSTSGEASAELAANVEVFSEAQQRWNALLKESVEAKKAVGAAEKSGNTKFSMRQNITGDSGKVYGDGVYLDSNLLDGLSDKERVQMVKARIAELGGQTFTAYDGDTPVEIKIENSRKRFKNKSGRFVQVNKDLTVKHIRQKIKQEAVILSDELIYASNYKENAPAHHSHGWLDNNGKNDWEKRTVIIQEKNNSVWKATLHIANTQNGEKILYDIDPIKKVESPRKLGATSTTDSIRQGEEKVNPKFSKRAEKLAQLDSEYAKAVESNDTETAERLVEEAARTAGYNSPLLYHGTQSFGFTKVDVSKSDDGISFFSTTNPDMAQTYSGEYGIRTIGKFSDRIINTLSLEQVVTRLNDLESNSKHPRKYYLMDRADVAKLEIKIKTETDTLLAEVQKLLEEKRNILARAREKNSWRADEYLDEIADTKYLIKALNNKDIVTMRDFAYGGDSYAVKFGDGLRELEANIRLKSKIDELGNVDRIFVGETEHRYTIGAFEAETARTILKGYDETGNYSLYGKTDDFFEIDGKGTYWSNIFATLEPKGGNTFRAEYDSNSSILKLSDKNGQFAEIPANTLSEAESAMAKAITKRYGEYFAANVLARAKDQLRNGALAEVNIKTVGRTSTREIAQFAKEQGYRGVKITNIYDNGGRGENAGTGDVYIFFNPETDVKSADAVTYDEEGNVIPLSERFNEKNKDIRFSKRTDSEGRELSEQQQEFFKDSKVRDEEGRLLTVYHGSDSEFFVFDRTKTRANMDIQGSFFSPWEIDAQGYGGKVGEYYLNIVNPASEAMGYKALKKFQGQNGAGIKAREYLQSLGYDGVNNGGEEYIAFESNQIKSVTNKAPTENPDIRFSKRKKLDTFNAEGYNEIKLGKQEYARLSAAIGTEQPNAKGIVTQILDNENGAPAFVYTAFIDNSGKLKIINKENAKYLGEGRRRYNANEKSKSFDRYAGEFENQRNDSDSSDFSIKRKANGRNDGVFSGIARGRDGRNGRGSNQDVSDSSEGSRKSLTVSNSTASGEVTLEVKKSTAEDDYTYDNIAIMLDGKEVGTIGMMADENEPYLERIDIDEAYRNKGIGTDALRLVAEKYGDFLIAPDNEDAKRLYERYGDESNSDTAAYIDQGYGVYEISSVPESKGYTAKQRAQREAISDLGKVQYQLRAEDKNRLTILDKQEERLRNDLKILEKAYGEAIREEYERSIKPSEETSRRAAEINRKAANRFMNEVGATFHVTKADREEHLLPIINEIIDKGPTISESEGLIDELYRTAYRNSSAYAAENSERDKELKDYIRKTAIYVDAGTRSDVGDYNSFRKNNMGKLRLTSDTHVLPLDVLYDEVRNVAPDSFSDTTDGAEKLYELAAFMEERYESIGDYMSEDEFVNWAKSENSSLDSELENLFDKTIGNFYSDASRKEKERTKAAKVNHATENINNAIKNYNKSLDAARAEGVLAGQMNQGAKDAAELRRVKERFANKEDAYINELRERRTQMAEERKAATKARNEAEARGVLAGQMAQGAKDAAKLRVTAESYENRIKAYRNKLSEVREKRDAALKARQEAFENYKAERADTAKRASLRRRIARNVNKLATMLVNPSDSKHIPQELRGAVAGFLNIFTDDAGVFTQNKLDALRAAYSSVAKEDSNIHDLYDPDIAEYMDTLQQRINGKKLSELSADELGLADAITGYFTHIVRDGNKLFIDGKNQSISELVEETISAADAKGDKVYRSGVAGKALRGADRFFNYQSVTPVYFFKRMGGGMEKLYNDVLYNGQLTYSKDINEAQEFMAAIYEKYHVWDWSSANQKNKKDLLKIKTVRGATLEMTRNEVLSTYATYKRGIANDDGAAHILQGGIVVKSKTPDGFFKKYVESSRGIQLEIADVQKILGFLTDEQKACADAVVNYLTVVEGEKRNETSMQLYGYKKFNESYYFPYRVANDYTKSHAGDTIEADGKNTGGGSKMIKSMGSSKALTPNANAAIVIDDFFKVAAESMGDTARYHAFAVQQDNFMRVLNYKGVVDTEHGGSTSVKQAIRDSYGTDGLNYITRFLGDIFGGAVQLDNSGLSGLFGKFKKTAVAANLSVAIQQPSAIMRATAFIDAKYLTKTIGQKNHLEEMFNYSSTAFLKNMGRFDVGTGRSTEQYILKPELKGKEFAKQLLATGEYSTGALDDVTGYLSEKADWVTWGHLMNSVMAEIEETTDLKRGTEEFKQAAGRRFDEIVNQSQVYDSALTKSPIMRSKNPLHQLSSAFMTEPTLSYNMVLDGLKSWKTNPGYLRKTLVAYALSVIANALFKSVIGAMRDKDEDKTYLEKYTEKFTGNVVSDLNPVFNLPYVSQTKDILQGGTVENQAYGMMSDAVSAIKNSYKKVQDEDYLGALGELTVVLNLTGLPVRNIYRDLSAVFNTVFNTKPLKDTTLEGMFEAAAEGVADSSFAHGIAGNFIDTSKTSGIKSAMRGGNTTKIRNETNKVIKQYVSDGKSESAAVGYIKTALTNYWKPRYLKADAKKKGEIRKALYATGIYKNSDAVVEMCNKWEQSGK